MQNPHAQINKPLPNTYIGSEILIQGTAKNIPKEYDLWIAHRRKQGGIIWPKEPMVIPDKKGHFSLTVFEGGTPGTIVISLLMVEKSISEKFSHWLEKGHQTNHYPGIDITNMPIKELTNIEVQYKKRRPLKIFYSYAHKDEDLRNELEKHLTILKREQYIENWHDRRLRFGTDFSQKINDEIKQADIVLLLVSPDFISSDYCYNIEMKFALKQHQQHGARVIPIIIRPTDWQNAPFGPLLALPKDGKPVTTWQNQDQAWVNVTQGIRKVINEISPLVDAPAYTLKEGKNISCRDEILEYLTKTKRSDTFTIQEVIDYMQQQHTKYKESTIRTHITSKMCKNAPDNHAKTYDDLERIGPGVYRLIRNN
jgi:hypothetical protein